MSEAKFDAKFSYIQRTLDKKCSRKERLGAGAQCLFGNALRASE